MNQPLKINNELVKTVNEVYHDLEADYYESRHVHLFEEERRNWQKFGVKYLKKSKLQVILDLGSGAGIVAQLVSQNLKKEDTFICSDISEEMLHICRKNLSGNNFENKFDYLKCSSDQIPLKSEGIDVITLNSLVHHIKDYNSLLKEIDRVLKPAGLIMMLHEPNDLYYKNKFLKNSAKLIKKIGSLVYRFKNNEQIEKEKGFDLDNFFKQVNQKLLSKGIIDKSLTAAEIQSLVDFHSPTSTALAEREGGINHEKIISILPNYKVLELFTFAHLGKTNPDRNIILKIVNNVFKKFFPKKGSAFGVILQKNV